jgi:hypothetical protein
MSSNDTHIETNNFFYHTVDEHVQLVLVLLCLLVLVLCCNLCCLIKCMRVNGQFGSPILRSPKQVEREAARLVTSAAAAASDAGSP